MLYCSSASILCNNKVADVYRRFTRADWRAGRPAHHRHRRSVHRWHMEGWMGHHSHLITGQNTFSHSVRRMASLISCCYCPKNKSITQVQSPCRATAAWHFNMPTQFQCSLWLVFIFLHPVDRTLPAHRGRGGHDGVGVDRRRPGRAWRKNEWVCKCSGLCKWTLLL